ncbi:syntaxin-11-like [Embiotoca jacksoni]|uniref:syntaxin-11-like n=1 Tax=Embiotoca jacksoni TaxID=100190 RepID=UPI003703D2D6
MRDRLSNLQQVQTDPDGFSTVELDNLSERGAAAAAGDQDRDWDRDWDQNQDRDQNRHQNLNQDQDQDQDLKGVLQEAQQIRLEIQQIQNDISELRAVNFQILNQTSFPVPSKRDSNAIGADVKRRGEAVLQRLHMMNALREKLEAQRGGTDPAARIAQTQYQCLSNALREVMFSYNDTEMSHREACRRNIKRHMEVVGREVSEQELEDMMEGEELTVFSVQVEGRTARSALLQIESRHRELLQLERRIQDIQELFLDVAVLTEEQGGAVDNIQKHVQNTDLTLQEAVGKLDRAKAADKSNPFKRLFCGCFPCYYN